MKLFSFSTILGWRKRHCNQENHRIPTMPRGELNYIISFQIRSVIFHQKSCFARIKLLMLFTLGNTSSPSLPSPQAPAHMCTHAYTHAISFSSQDPLCFIHFCQPNMYTGDSVIRSPKGKITQSRISSLIFQNVLRTYRLI